MSKIDKLSILGVRSFDNQRSETIQFFSPLTLVVGYNGSGKTTIIECLKYATTGILPANSKQGGAFIHDPKLCGEKEVLAQVKLQFKASTGARMVATRSLQLTVKKTTRSQKTLEGQLLMLKDGERTSISSRVAELDLILPQYLGVSTAVLDNVIFCHQDDSLWPLSEPASLKKKFDEIFEAQKYTMAIDNIKKLRKAHNEDLGKYKIVEQHAKGDKDKADRAKTQAGRLDDQIGILREQVTDLGIRMEHAAAAADKAWKEGEGYAQILGALEGKRIEAESKRTTINDLKVHLKEVLDSDEWLQSTLDEYESRLENYQEQKQAKQDEYLERKAHYDSQRHQLQLKHTERGKNESDKAEYDRQLARRKDMVRETAAKHGMRGYDDLTVDTLVEDFIFKIQKISKEQIAFLENARREADSEKRDALSLFNRLTERKSALQDTKISAKRQTAQHDRDVADFQKKAGEISVDEGTKAMIESRVEDVNTRMQQAKELSTRSDWDKQLREANADLRAGEDETFRLNNELIQGHKKAGEMAKLVHLKQELKDRQRSLQTMLSTHTTRIETLLGPDWTPATIEQVHRTAMDEATREATSAEQIRDSVSREMEQVLFKQKTLRMDLSQKTRASQEYYNTVKKTIDAEPSQYQQIVSEMQENLENMRDSAGASKSMTSYLTKILDTASQSHDPKCRVCERPFKHNDPALTRMKNKLTGLIDRAAKEAGEEELKEAEADYQSVVDAIVPLENWKRLTETEIPGLEQELDRLSQQHKTLTAKIEEHDNSVEKRQSSMKELEQVSRTVASIAKCNTETVSLESQIEETLSKSQNDMSRMAEDIQSDISDLAEKVQATKKRISQLTAEKDQSRSEISDMELELRELQNQMTRTTFELKDKAALMVRVEEFKALKEKQRHAVDQIDRDMENLDPEIATAKAQYDDVTERVEEKDREMSAKVRDLNNSVNALHLLNEQIKSYIDRGGPTRLSDTTREIRRIEQELKTIESEQNETTREINKLQEQLRDSENIRRQYSDNLRYRQESRALETLDREIDELAAHNADVDRDRFQEESRKRTKEHQRLSAEQAGLIGEIKSKDVQLVELLADFETDFKDAPRRYKEAHIKVETTRAAVEDLGRYSTALDKAIMKYHGLKMEEINRIIEELWQQTYRGTDVDTIMIKSGNDNEAAATSARSHNYRVVMVKQGAEMDMRGRCSAGQKVLASIIIRLALAECFGTNCGLIALDEPTTNLDEDNIRSLAESLHGIIKHRQAQSNFQLIIITHDEGFLRHMQCGDFTDYYYRVSRDPKCNSIIERQSIAEVM